MSTAQSVTDAQRIRASILTMLESAGSGHAGGPLGMADVFAVLYRSVLRHKPEFPTWSGRDRVVLSNGHICPVLYATLALHGYFPESELQTLRKQGSLLQGHPHELPEIGIETTSGPLGQGLSQAVGIALAGRLQLQKWHVFALLSDGEHQEGQTWEAYLMGAKEQLSNLTVVIDRNYIQISGVTESVMPLDPLGEKLSAFGWTVYEVNGHDHEALQDVLKNAQADGQPSAIIAYTEPGRGVSHMEGKYSWHGYDPDKAATRAAIREINSLQGKLETQHG